MLLFHEKILVAQFLTSKITRKMARNQMYKNSENWQCEFIHLRKNIQNYASILLGHSKFNQSHIKKLTIKSIKYHTSSLKLHNWGQTNILCTTNKMKMIWYHRTRHRLLQKPNFTFFGFFAPSNRYWGHVFALKSGNRFRAGLNFDQFDIHRIP